MYQQAKEVLAEHTHLVFDLVDRASLTEVVRQDPATVPSHVRRGVDRVLDLYHWLDMYRPQLV